MSVTIERQPEDFQPVFNQNRWIVESNNTAQTNFEYICDVYVNAGSTYIARLKRFPDSDGYGDFDLSRVLADYVSVTLAASNDNGFNLHRNHYVNYVLKFGEIYNGTTYTNLTVTSSQVALMMALSFNQFYDYDYEQYASGVGSPSVDIKFLTNSPRTLKARRNGYAELHFLNATTSNSSYLKINSYLPSGSLIASYTIANPYVTVNVNNKWVSVGVGIYNLNTATLSSGVQLVVDDDAGSYDVALYDTSNNRTSEIITFEIDETCNRYEGKHIKFLNRLGGFDTFFFSSNENVFIDVGNREQYTKLAGTVSGSPVTWGYNLSDRGQKVIAVDSQERTILKSGALTDAEYVWLRELITSPEVYAIETYNGTIYDRPIVITT